MVEFRNVFFKYRPELDYVLRDLNVTFAGGGTMIGICGRTGLRLRLCSLASTLTLWRVACVGV